MYVGAWLPYPLNARESSHWSGEGEPSLPTRPQREEGMPDIGGTDSETATKDATADEPEIEGHFGFCWNVS